MLKSLINPARFLEGKLLISITHLALKASFISVYTYFKLILVCVTKLTNI